VNTEQALQDFLQTHQLPATFLAHAQQWFVPLAEQLVQHRRQAGRPLIVGINGSQGSGKSTLASFLSLLFPQEYGLRSIDLSIDDFYLTRQERTTLAKNVHPLLATRGVPGTHDVELLRTTLQALAGQRGRVAIPRFDKAQDDRSPAGLWPSEESPVDIIILEGWCLGARAQQQAQLLSPVNQLESSEDAQGLWRGYVNTRLEADYHDLYDMVDIWAMLQAPSFDSVFRWRLEQEQKLSNSHTQSGSRIMSADQVARFIQHYQRLTQHALETMPSTVNYLFQLDEQRQILRASQPKPVRFP